MKRKKFAFLISRIHISKPFYILIQIKRERDVFNYNLIEIREDSLRLQYQLSLN